MMSDTSDKIVWLGHAKFFIQLSGIRILIDPLFGKFPVGKRYSELPVEPDKLVSIDPSRGSCPLRKIFRQPKNDVIS